MPIIYSVFALNILFLEMFGLPMNSRGNINQLLSEVIDATIQENELLFSKMPDFIIQSKRFM